MTTPLREMDETTIQQVKTHGSSFEVKSKLVLRMENGKIRYDVVDVPPYTKQYGAENVNPAEYLASPDRVVFFAFQNEEIIGQIRVLKYWNGYAYIDDIAVDANHRRRGVGRALIERSIEWAKSKRLPGMMLETQNNNVAACRLYERCGFELSGFDANLYKGIDPATDEIALYWYLIF